MPGPASYPRLWHDLRSQVNQITGYSEMMSDEAAEAGLEKPIEELHEIDRSGGQIAALIDRFAERGDSIDQEGLRECLAAVGPIVDGILANCQALRGADATAEWEGGLDVIRDAAKACRRMIQAAVSAPG